MAKRGPRPVERVEVTCPCSKVFLVRKKRLDAGRGRYCSRECQNLYQDRVTGRTGLTYVKHKDNPTSFKPESVPWNKGTTGLMPAAWNKGIATGVVPPNAFQPGDEPWNKGTTGVMPAGEAHHAWAGDAVGYLGRHIRVRQARGPADHCINGCTHTRYEWAHRHDTDPLDLDNYDPMCKTCHVRYDARLTAELAAEIRRRAGSVTQGQLAAEYAVSQSTISLIVSGKRWA